MGYLEEHAKKLEEKKLEQEKQMKAIKKWVRIGIAALVLLILITNSIGTVPVNHTGVWKRLGVVQEQAVPEGIHLKIPFVDQIETISNLVQTTTILASQTDKNATTSETAETKDQQLIMSYQFEIQYQLNPSQSFVIYKNYGKNYEKMLIVSNVMPIIKQAFARYNSEEITANKDAIAQYIQSELAAYTETFGINILRVNFVSYDFTNEYHAILEERAALKAQVINEELRQNQERVAAQTAYDVAVKRAEQEAETARIAADNAKEVALVKAEQDKEVALVKAEQDRQTQLIQANAKAEAAKIAVDNEAYVTTTRAEADKTARLAAAEATKAELEAQSAGLTDLIVQRQFVEKWNGQLVPSFGRSGAFTFADLTGIYQQFLGGNAE